MRTNNANRRFRPVPSALVLDTPNAAVRWFQGLLANEAVRLAQARSTVPAGKFTVEGVIVSTEVVTGFGYGKRTKMTVRDNRGFTVYGTKPSCIEARAFAGDVVRFDAALEPSRQDFSFGFFARPANAVIVRKGA